MNFVRCIAFVLAMTAGSTGLYAADPAKVEYLLGPQDRLTIRVYDLRKNAGEAYPWAALNGEFSVGADGSVSLPILGSVKAAGGTTAELADVISRTLKQKADLAELPSASVEVLKYRPFYVMGAVQRPGKYDFQPGLTVLQAVSVAQGFARAADQISAERDSVNARGDVRALAAERITLEAKMARLSAEIAEAQTVTYPAELTARASDPRVAAAMREETLRFEARRGALKAEIETIEQSKVLLRQELAALEAKGKSLDRQLELSRKELALINELVQKGLSVTPRQLAAENNQALYMSNRLDVQVATLRAQQNLARADRDSVEIRTRYRKEALDEAAVTRARLDQVAERALTAERLMHNADMLSPDPTGDLNDPVPAYKLTRITPSGPVTWAASEDDALEAGDVLRVALSRPARNEVPANAQQSAAAAPPSAPTRTATEQQ